MQFRNEKLAQALKNWLEEANTFARDKTPVSKELSTSGTRRVVHYGPSGESWSEVAVPQPPSGILYDHRDQIPTLPACHNLLEVLREDPTGSELEGKFVGTSAGAWLVEWDELPERFIHEYWLRNRSLEYDSTSFTDVYETLESFIYDDELPRTLTTPVQNFDSDADFLNFGHGLNARLITPAIYESLYLRGGTFRSEYRIEYRGMRSWLLTITTREKKLVRGQHERATINENLWKKPYRLAESLMKALRICKNGAPAFRFVDEYTPWAVHGGQAYPGLTFPKSDKLILLASEIAEFNNFFDLVQRVDPEKARFLRVAIDRFSNAMDRISPEDSVIDLSICLEALLLSGLGNEEDRGNLSYRFALHGARLLGRDLDERKQLYRKLKNVYGVRSRIVHGAGSYDLPKDDSGQRVTIDKFRDVLEELARACFRKFLTSRVDWDAVALS